MVAAGQRWDAEARARHRAKSCVVKPSHFLGKTGWKSPPPLRTLSHSVHCPPCCLGPARPAAPWLLLLGDTLSSGWSPVPHHSRG